MILYLDIGNTRLKWRVENGGDYVSGGGGFLAQLDRVLNSIHECMSSLLCQPDSLNPVNELKYIFASSVASDMVNENIHSFCSDRLNVQPHFVLVEKKFGGVTAAYSDVATLGVDRWLALLAAHQQTKASCLVIDAGSAITVDLIDVDGIHCGGMIAPGMRTLSNSLISSTTKVMAKAPAEADVKASLDVKDELFGFGVSTPECVEAGVSGMFYGFVSSVALAFQGRFECVFIAGGDGEDVLRAIDEIFPKGVLRSGSRSQILQRDMVNDGADLDLADIEVGRAYTPKEILHRPDLVIEGLKCWCQAKRNLDSV